MKILFICGSPKMGNTETMLKEAANGALSAGAEAEVLLLRERDITHCTSCMACNGHGDGACPVQDDMQEIYRKVEGSDVLVFGSPVYYDNVSSILKTAMDRFCKFFTRKELLQKKFAVMVAGGKPEGEGSIERAVESIVNFGHLHWMRLAGCVVAGSTQCGSVESDPVKLKECFDFGARMVSAAN